MFMVVLVPTALVPENNDYNGNFRFCFFLLPFAASDVFFSLISLSIQGKYVLLI